MSTYGTISKEVLDAADSLRDRMIDGLRKDIERDAPGFLSSQTEQSEPAEHKNNTRVQIRLAMARRLREKLESGQFSASEELQVIQTIEKLTKVGEKGLTGYPRGVKRKKTEKNSPFS